MSKRKTKVRRNRLSEEEKAQRHEQRTFRRNVQSVFETAGFEGLKTKGKNVNFLGRISEFDFIFVHENIVIIAEDTCTSPSSRIRDHVLKKNSFYDHVRDNKDAFIDFLESEFPDFKGKKRDIYAAADMMLLVVYCSKYRMEDDHKKPFDGIIFFENRHVEYFMALAKTLGKTMRFELFKFLGLKAKDIGVGAGVPRKYYDGFILPESPSGFPDGFKIITFYIDPATLMELSYVLRKDGWMDGDGLYQRMISRSKIRGMRQYLSQDQRVFINNAIVSLPSSTKVLATVGNKEINVKEITKTTSIRVEIPIEFDTIGIIDGQHRVFAYHEGRDTYEASIAPKRKKQQLLVTGVVYPSAIAEDKQREFEAGLFLEINDKQTKTRADLRQAIEAIVNPFSVIAISKAVINRLGATGPLCGMLEEHQFDRGKLKSSSIVSYGLKHVVKSEGEDSLFKLWRHGDKQALADAIQAATKGKKKFSTPAKSVLSDYIEFCTREINNVLIGFSSNLSAGLWTLDRKKSLALTTTAINGVIHCMRLLVEKEKTTTMDGYKKAFSKLAIDFSKSGFKYKSSHWGDLGEKIFTQCFL